MQAWCIVVLAAVVAAGCAAPPPDASSSDRPHGLVPPPRDPVPADGLVQREAVVTWNGTWAGLAADRRIANGTHWAVLPADQGPGVALSGTGEAPSTLTDTGAAQPPGNWLAAILQSLLEPAYGVVVEFIGQAYLPGAAAATWLWDFGDGTTATGQTSSHTFAAPGNYTVRLRVTAADGTMVDSWVPVRVAPFAPPLSIQAMGQGQPLVMLFSDTLLFHRVAPGHAITLTAQPLAGLGNGTVFHWDFGDGSTAEGRVVTHAYTAEGNYTVRVTMTTASGASSDASRQVRVRWIPPTVRIWEFPAFPGVTLQAQAWDADGSIASYDWDLGNGTHVAGRQIAITRPGTYNVTITVADDDGLTAQALRQVVVHPQPPTVFAVFASSAEGDPWSFTFSASASDPDGPLVAYAWDFGDGSTGEGPTPTHRYSAGGQYVVALTVTDSDRLSASRSRSLLVPE
ncbi:MAG TPA: PKD domain-containing protein [Candidatus Thermoplasmatota archaeon]|nr:PKD domain-containing protein [Candidatus Thermoplasmatota archaeon]